MYKRQDASRATPSEIDAAHAAQSERDRALATVVDLREELAVQTASTATATTALADAQQEAARATIGRTKPQRGAVRQSSSAMVHSLPLPICEKN